MNEKYAKKLRKLMKRFGDNLQEKQNRHSIHEQYPYESRISDNIRGNFRTKTNFLYESQAAYVSQMIQPMYHQQPVIGPKTVVLYRTSKYGFGFTLRHFIVYPPESPEERNIAGILNITQPMDTVFVKDVRLNGPAHIGGLRPGDRLLSVNGMQVAGTPYANVVLAIQQTPSILRLIVVPKDYDILQTLFSESAHSPESNQRPCIYANPHDVSFNAIQSNANHVPVSSPNLELTTSTSNSSNNVAMANMIRVNPNARHLTEMAHRHSFNESIYSEPYGGRFVAGGGNSNSSNRLESIHRPNPLSESASASNIYSGKVVTSARTHPQYFFPQNHLSHRDVYATTSSIASNGLSTEASSTRSSVYSDKTILNEQTPPSTPRLSHGANEQTIKATHPNKTAASNASGSHANLQSKPINTNTTEVLTQQTNSNTLAKPASANGAEATNTGDQKSEQINQPTTAPVMRRQKTVSNSTERSVRRISYLRATANDISLQETDKIEENVTTGNATEIKEEKTQLSEELQMLAQFFKRNPLPNESMEHEHEGKLSMKIAYIENEKAQVRQWHRVLAKLCGDRLQITILRNCETKEEPTDIAGAVNLRQFHVTKSSYTKRKHVFKLTNIAPDAKPASPLPIVIESKKTEFLIQADDQSSYDLWKSKLEKVTRPSDDSTEHKMQLPQKEKMNGSTSTLEREGSSKSRTWKGLVARQFRRIQGTSLPNSTNSSIDIPNVASIGVPLALCPISEKNKYVPLIMARCTEIVETRGLSIVGIYRIPGNTAAISALTELVNKGFDEQTLNDPRWDDVNVVSSLLKSFLRRLPEALIPNDMYKQFIEADNQTGQKRLIALKELVNNISIQFYESLKHLMHHLFLVSQNCHVNLMEPKNLAIIFGPSVVRTCNETLETVVKDMKHQCRIVEALVSNYEYFFENGEVPKVVEQPEPVAETTPRSQTNLLLDNVAKIESYTDQMEKTRFVFKFVQAARSRKSKKKQTSLLSSMTSDTMSMDSSSTSTEYRDSSITKAENLTDVDGIQSSLSADDAADLFCEDTGSMSLATLIPALEDKFYALHNGSFDSETGQCLDNDDTTDSTSPLTPSILRNHQLISMQPLTIGDESIPYADDSPDQPALPAINDKPIEPQPHNYPYVTIRNKPWNPAHSNRIIGPKAYRTQDAVDTKSINSISTDDNDTDESNTSDHEGNQTIRINREVIREMNRILTTLERKATKFSKLNRSLSLNIKYHHNECCCNSGHIMSNSNHSSCRSIAMNRYSLTKDEKTDKNINLAKKRQIQDNNNKSRRYTNRPIKRRHTVGGIHYGYNSKTHPVDTTPTR